MTACRTPCRIGCACWSRHPIVIGWLDRVRRGGQIRSAGREATAAVFARLLIVSSRVAARPDGSMWLRLIRSAAPLARVPTGGTMTPTRTDGERLRSRWLVGGGAAVVAALSVMA